MRLVDHGTAALQAAPAPVLAQDMGAVAGVGPALGRPGPAAAFFLGAGLADHDWKIGRMAHFGALPGFRDPREQVRRPAYREGVASRSIWRCISSTRALSSDSESCWGEALDEAGASAAGLPAGADGAAALAAAAASSGRI